MFLSVVARRSGNTWLLQQAVSREKDAWVDAKRVESDDCGEAPMNNGSRSPSHVFCKRPARTQLHLPANCILRTATLASCSTAIHYSLPRLLATYC